MSKVFIIAEAGVNHNGSLDMALRLVDAATDAGADAVKFQTFKTELLVSRDAEKAEYQKKNCGADESQFDMLKKLELSISDHEAILAHCQEKGIMFFSTAFDLESIRYLSSLDMPMMKVPSGEITNLPYLRAIDECRKPVILSTGMATMEEVADAVTVFKKSPVTLLHCTTEYPCPFTDVNLRAMLTLKERFGLPVGYSDHTSGFEVTIAAVALGASVIEKHFTLDRNLPGPDHKASIEPYELKAMVTAIRNVESALGTDIKQPTQSELATALIARKSIVASRSIKKGEIFSSENLTIRRPGKGLSPMLWDSIIGLKAKRDYKYNDFIEKEILF